MESRFKVVVNDYVQKMSRVEDLCGDLKKAVDLFEECSVPDGFKELPERERSNIITRVNNALAELKDIDQNVQDNTGADRLNMDSLRAKFSRFVAEAELRFLILQRAHAKVKGEDISVFSARIKELARLNGIALDPVLERDLAHPT